MFAAAIADKLDWVTYAVAKLGNSNMEKPKPWPRPGHRSQTDVKKYEADTLSADQLDAIFNL